MAEKAGSPNLEFAVAQLKKNPKIEFAVLKQQAEKKGLKMVPIIFGRAKLALGIAKKGGGTRKAAARVASANGRTARASSGSGLDGQLAQLGEAVRRADALQRALDEIRAIVEQLAAPPKRGPGRPRKIR